MKKNIIATFKKLKSKFKNNFSFVDYLSKLKFGALNKFKSDEILFKDQAEIRYKPTPTWTRSLQWAIVGITSFGFLYAVVARIDEVVTAEGDLQAIGAERPLKAPFPGIVSEIKVIEGQLVEKGEVVLKFDTEVNNERLTSLTKQVEFEELNLEEEVKIFNSKRMILNTIIQTSIKLLDSEQKISKKMETLLKEGGISEFDYLRQNQKITNLMGKIEENKIKLSENKSLYKKNTQKIRSDIASLERQIFETLKKKEYEFFKSPIKGYVFDLIPSSSGYSANTGETLVKIVPIGDVEAKVLVTNENIGFLRKNMDAEIRVNAYPFTQFGNITGKLRLIGKEALPGNERNPDPRFPVIVKLDKQFLERKNKKYDVSAGQTVIVNFKVRRKPVISLLTDSIEKAFDSLRGIRTDEP